MKKIHNFFLINFKNLFTLTHKPMKHPLYTYRYSPCLYKDRVQKKERRKKKKRRKGKRKRKRKIEKE